MYGPTRSARLTLESRHLPSKKLGNRSPLNRIRQIRLEVLRTPAPISADIDDANVLIRDCPGHGSANAPRAAADKDESRIHRRIVGNLGRSGGATIRGR